MNELLWKFTQALENSVSIHNIRIPVLVGTCRRRLEEFTDTLIYRVFPRFCPFPNAKEGERSRTPFDEFPKTLPQAPMLSSNVTAIPVPDIVYLDEVMRRCDVYVPVQQG
jgi:hypothetical protein